MKKKDAQAKNKCDTYIIDTCKIGSTGEYLPGAITYKGRKRMETKQWKTRTFQSQEEADAFVRDQLREDGLREAENEGELVAGRAW